MGNFNEAYRKIAGFNETGTIPEADITARQVLYLDGIICGGKTTALELMAKDILDAVIIPEFNLAIPAAYDNIGTDAPLVNQLRAEFWFYQQHLVKDKLIRQNSGKIIADRGILGMFCYSNLFGENSFVSEKIIRRAINYSWTPGQYIFLTAEPEILKSRFLKRGGGTLMERSWDEGIGRYIDRLHQSVGTIADEVGIPLLDTSERSPEQVTATIKQLYSEFFSLNI